MDLVVGDRALVDQAVWSNDDPLDQSIVLADLGAQVVRCLFVVCVRWQHPT